MAVASEEATIAKVHVSLNVSDVERSTTFYEAFLGVLAHKRRPGYANFDLANPPLKLALQEHAPETQGVGALSHLGMVVHSREAVQAARERLIAAGLATFDERDTLCCYARQDKVWVHDPDGNGWEVYVLLDDMQDEDHHSLEPEACCLPVTGIEAGEAKAGPKPCCA